MYDAVFVTGYEFEQRLKKLGRARGIAVRYTTRGKGSHGRIYYGERFATPKDWRKELGSGLVRAMSQQLGIEPNDL